MNEELEPVTTSVGLSLSLSPLADIRGNLAATLGEALSGMLGMFYPPPLCKKANIVVIELVQNVLENICDGSSEMRLSLRINPDELHVKVVNKVTVEQYAIVKERVDLLATEPDPRRLFADTLRSRRSQRLRGGLGLIRLVSENRFQLSAEYVDEYLTMQAVFFLRGAQ